MDTMISCLALVSLDPLGLFTFTRLGLASVEAIKKGSSSGEIIVVGKSEKSLLVHTVAGLIEDMLMPPEGKADPLTKEQIALLRAWIDQGAK